MKLREIARAIGAVVEGDPELEIDDLQPLETAGKHHVTFLSNPRYQSKLDATQAGAVILGEGVAGPGCAVLRVPNAYLGFAMALQLFARPALPALGVDPTASVAPSAAIGDGARIGPRVVVGEGARIGARCALFPGAVLYPEV